MTPMRSRMLSNARVLRKLPSATISRRGLCLKRSKASAVLPRVPTGQWYITPATGLRLMVLTTFSPSNSTFRPETILPERPCRWLIYLDKVGVARRLNLVILDACVTIRLRTWWLLPERDRPPSKNRARAATQGLADVTPPAGILLAYASKHGTVALDGSGQQQPLCTGAC